MEASSWYDAWCMTIWPPSVQCHLTSSKLMLLLSAVIRKTLSKYCWSPFHHNIISASLSLSWLVISPVGNWPKVQIFSGIPLNLSKWHAKTTQLHQPNHPQNPHSKFLTNSTSLVLAWSRRRHDSGNHPQLLWPRIWKCVPAPESTLEISQAPTTKPRHSGLVTLQDSSTVEDRTYKNSPSEGMSCNQLRCH